MAANLFDSPGARLVTDPYTGETFEVSPEIESQFLPLRPRPAQQPAPPSEPEPMTPEWADYGRLVMRGGAGIGAGAGWVMKSLGLEDAGKAIETLGNDAVDYWTESLSDPMKERMAKQFVVQNPETGEYEWGVNLKEGLQLGVAMGAESVLGTMAGMGVGGAAAKGLMAVATKLSPVLQTFGNPVGRAVLQQAVQKGAGAAVGSREAAMAIAAAKKLAFIDRTLMLTGAAGFGAGEGLVSSMTAAPSAYEMVKNMDPAKLATNERYRQVFDSTDDTLSWEERHAYAAETVAMESASVAGFQSGLTTALLGAPMGAFFGKLIGKGAQSALGKTPLRAGITGAAGEAAQEFAQSGSEQLIANKTAIAAGDSDKSPWEGVLNQAVGGAVAGAVMGGGFGLFEAERPTTPPAAAPTTPPAVPPAVTGAPPTAPGAPPAGPGTPPAAGTPTTPIAPQTPPAAGPATTGAAPAAPAAPIQVPPGLKPKAQTDIQAKIDEAIAAGVDPVKLQEVVNKAAEPGQFLPTKKAINDLIADVPTTPTTTPEAQPVSPPKVRTQVIDVPFQHSVYAEPDGTFSWMGKGGEGTGFKTEAEALAAAETATGKVKPVAPQPAPEVVAPPEPGVTTEPVGGESARPGLPVEPQAGETPATPEPAPAEDGKPGYTPGEVQSGPELPPPPPVGGESARPGETPTIEGAEPPAPPTGEQPAPPTENAPEIEHVDGLPDETERQEFQKSVSTLVGKWLTPVGKPGSAVQVTGITPAGDLILSANGSQGRTFPGFGRQHLGLRGGNVVQDVSMTMPGKSRVWKISDSQPVTGGWPDAPPEKRAEYVEKLRKAFAKTAEIKARDGGTGMFDPGRENLRERKVFDEIVETLQKEHGLKYYEAQKAALEYVNEARKPVQPQVEPKPEPKPKKPTTGGGTGKAEPKKPSLPERVGYIKRMVTAFEEETLEDTSDAIIGDLQKKHGLSLEEAEKLATEYEEEARKQVDKTQAKADKKAEKERQKAAKQAAERPAKVASKTSRLKNRTFREVAQLEAVMAAAEQEGNFRDNAMEAVVAHVDQQKAEDDLEAEALANVRAFVGEVSKENQEFWEGLQKEARKQRRIQDRQKYRTKEVYETALTEALDEAELSVDSEEAKAFRAGWDHMLAGKTASTLIGDNMRSRRDGYDAAKRWVRSSREGKAWYDGAPLEKEKATGVRVKRRMDELRREVEAMTDLELAWKEIEKDTSRIALFNPTLAEGATPGTKRYVERLRERIMPLKSYLKKQVFRRRGWTFEKSLQQLAKRTPTEVDDIKKQILSVAEEYQKLIGELNDTLENSDSVLDASTKLTAYYVKRPTPNSPYSTTEQAENLNRFMRDGFRWWHPFVRPLPGSNYYGAETRDLERGEQDAPDERTKPLRHPRLDRIIREGRKDHRKGKDVTSKDFKEAFGFADVDMGEWVQSRESRDNLNYAFDAFMDLADLMRIPPEAIGLGKVLHFSVGRTGRGAKAAAHFSNREKVENPKAGEPDEVPNINITKEHGDGSLAHEWTHALDWLNGTVVEDRRPTLATTVDVVQALKYQDKDWLADLESDALDYLRGKKTWWGMPPGSTPRDHMVEWLRNTHFQRMHTNFYGAALKLDGGQAGKYWSDAMELIARAGEAYICDRLMGLQQDTDPAFMGPPKPAINNYLVNPAFAGDGKAKPPMYRGTPYPAGDERSLMHDIMKVWYDAIEMKDGKPTIKENAAEHLNPGKNFAKAKDALMLRIDELEAQVAQEKAEEAKKSEEQRRQDREKQEAEQRAKDEAERKKREEAGRMPGWSVESIRAVPDFMDTQPGPLGIFQGLFNLMAEQLAWAQKSGEKITDAMGDQRDANWFEAVGIARDHKVPPIWENPQVDNEELPPKEDPGDLSDEERDKLIEDIFALDDEADEAPGEDTEEAQPEKPKKPRGEAKPREPKPAGEKRERKPKAATDKTAGELIREAGKLGVKGIDEALTGLAELFGGSKGGRLNSFPAGFDQEAYARAKPHFEAALTAFKAAGRTLADFVSVIKASVPKDLRPGWMVMLQQFVREKGLNNDLSTKAERDGRSSTQPSDKQGAAPQPESTEPGVPGDVAGGASAGPQADIQRRPGANGTGGAQDGGLPGDANTPAGAGGNADAGAGAGTGATAGGAVGGGQGRGTGPVTGGAGQANTGGSGDNAPAEPPVEDLFEDYTPAKVKIEGAQAHPGDLVQSAAMSSVEPPDPTYVPDLPPATISEGKLSIAQLESIVYGNMAFAQFLPNGERMGFAIGDGTGVGKGREIAGFILDQFRRGNKRHIWVTEKIDLGADALRDMLGVGLDVPILMYDRPKKWPKLGQDNYRPLTLQRDKKAPLSFGDGVVIVTYDNLRSAGGQIVDHLTSWAGKGYEGMLVFDEAHSLGNAVAKRGLQPSKKAAAGMNLTENLRMARTLYVSATMATEPRNLGFLRRLGLWGDGTAFANAADFIDNITSLGKVAMETVARDMKALGLYISRTLSYKPVKFKSLEHHADAEEALLYDDAAKLWDTLRTEIQMAMAWSGLGDNTMSQYWGAHQRFFNLFMTSLSTAAVIEQIRAVTTGENGGTAVVQLVNHYGSMTEEMASKDKAAATDPDEEIEDESLSMTPAQIIESWIEKKFPIYNYVAVPTVNPKTGKPTVKWEPVRGQDGKPAEVKELVERRDAMLKLAVQLGKNAKMPGNPINMIVEAFPDQTVEVSGRKKRYIRKTVDGKVQVTEEARTDDVLAQELDDFTNDRKRILIFSEKGGTGFSYHASKEPKNKNRRQRHHFVLQAGWKADKTFQGMGRTHRTFQESAPIYYLVKTDIEAQSRFISAIASRLGQLGALAMGERKGASQGLFQDDEDIQDEYGVLALQQIFRDIFDGRAEINVPPDNRATVIADLENLLASLRVKPTDVIDAIGVLSAGNTDQQYAQDIARQMYRAARISPPDPRRMTNRVIEDLAIIVERWQAATLGRSRTMRFNEILRLMGKEPVPPHSSWQPGLAPDMHDFLNRSLGLSIKSVDGYDGVMKQLFALFNDRRQDMILQAKENETYDEGLELIPAMSVKKVIDKVIAREKRTGAATRYLELELTQKETVNTFQEIEQIATVAGEQFSGFFRDNTDGKVFAVIRRKSQISGQSRGQRWDVTGAPRMIDNVDNILRGGQERLVDKEGPTFKGGAFSIRKEPPAVKFDATPLIVAAKEGGLAAINEAAGKDFARYIKDHSTKEQELMREAVNEAKDRVTKAHAAWASSQVGVAPAEKTAFGMNSFTVAKKAEGYPETFWATTLVEVFNERGQEYAAEYIKRQLSENADSPLMQEAINEGWARVQKEAVTAVAPRRVKHYTKLHHVMAPALEAGVPTEVADWASPAWDAALAAAPKTKTVTQHMIAGATLPVWDKFDPGQKIRVGRVKADDETILGRLIKEADLDRVLQKLGVSILGDLTPVKLMGRVMKGQTISLANGVKLMKDRHGGANVIRLGTDYYGAREAAETLDNPTSPERIAMQAAGVRFTTRKSSWSGEQPLVYIEGGDTRAFETVLKWSPAMKLEGSFSASRSIGNGRYSTTPAAVRSWIAPLVRELGSVVRFDVVQSVGDLNDESIPSDIEGVYWTGTNMVTLVADRLPNQKRAALVAIHEVFGHLAVEAHPLFEDALSAVIRLKAMNHKGVVKLWNEVAATQPSLDQRMHAKEVLALIAEKDMDLSLWAKLKAKLRAFLRGLTGQEWTDADLVWVVKDAGKSLMRRARAENERLEQADRAGDLNARQARNAILAQAEGPWFDKPTQRTEMTDQEWLGRSAHLDRSFSRAAPMDTATEAAYETAFGQKPNPAFSARDMARGWVQRFKTHDWLALKQGVVDAYASVEALEKELHGQVLDAADSAWKAMLATKNHASMMAAVMVKGVPKYTGGIFKPVTGRKGFIEILRPAAEHQDGNLIPQLELFLAANRAQRLIGETNRDGTVKEQRMTPAAIAAGLALEQKYPFFRDILNDWKVFNGQALDLAEEAGILDPEMRKLWEEDDYVPFYRVLDELDVMAPGKRKGFSGQKAMTRALKGGPAPLNSIIENMVMNTSSLLDRANKNLAMQKIVGLAEGHGLTREPKAIQAAMYNDEQIARALKNVGIDIDPNTPLDRKNQKWVRLFRRVAPKGDNVVSVYRIVERTDAQGVVTKHSVPEYYRVDDPLLLRSIQGMGPDQFSGVVKLFQIPKRLLTAAVTADPAFMAANLVRDTLANWIQSDVKGNPITGALKGIRSSLKEDPEVWAIMMAGGGGGGYYDSNPAEIRKLLRKHVSDAKMGGFLDSIVSPKKAWAAWHRFGAATENANRIAVYNAVKKAGGSEAEAVYQARDVLNFSMSGDHAVVRFLITTVPFMNARIQGLYRLQRGYKDHPWSFLGRGLSLLAATMILAAANAGDDEYEELPEWDKDIYWHVFFPPDENGKREHLRIPKPFELGIIFGTVPERVGRLAAGYDQPKEFMRSMGRALMDTLAFNPIPQAVKPAIEQFANRSMFTGSAIVGAAEKPLKAEQQYTPWTSETTRVIADLMPGFAPEFMRSPKRLEHLVRAYTGAIGMYALSSADFFTRRIGDFPERPSMKIYDLPVVERFVRDPDPRITKYSDSLYEMLDEANAVFSSINRLQKGGQAEEAKQMRAENLDKLRARKNLNNIAADIRKLNNRIRLEMVSNRTPEEKRERIDALTARKNERMRQIQQFEGTF